MSLDSEARCFVCPTCQSVAGMACRDAKGGYRTVVSTHEVRLQRARELRIEQGCGSTLWRSKESVRQGNQVLAEAHGVSAKVIRYAGGGGKLMRLSPEVRGVLIGRAERFEWA
jgi:hypothetical protein